MNLKLVSILASALIFGTLAIGLQACSEDDEKPKNEFTLNGETFALASGYLELYQDQHPTTGDPIFNWTVNLESDIIASPLWNQVRFNLHSNIGTSFTPGTYTYDNEHSKNNFTFFFGGVTTKYDIQTGEGNQFEDFESGTVTIARTNTEYTVLFDIVLAGGDKVKGSFTGDLHVEQ